MGFFLLDTFKIKLALMVSQTLPTLSLIFFFFFWRALQSYTVLCTALCLFELHGVIAQSMKLFFFYINTVQVSPEAVIFKIHMSEKLIFVFCYILQDPTVDAHT